MKKGIAINQTERLTRLAQNGKNLEEISVILGRSRERVKQAAQTLGLEIVSSEEQLRLKKTAQEGIRSTV